LYGYTFSNGTWCQTGEVCPKSAQTEEFSKTGDFFFFLRPTNRIRPDIFGILTRKQLSCHGFRITLTIIESKNSVARHLTPLSQLQINILERLGLNAATYTKLEIRQSVNILNE